MTSGRDRRARRSTVRAAAAFVLGLVAIVGLVVATVGVWARATVDDGSQVSQAVAAALDEPETLDSLALLITDRALDVIGVDRIVERVAPSVLSSLQPRIADTIHRAVYGQVREFLGSDAARAGVERIALIAHRGLDRLLDDEPLAPWASVTDGTVAVDLLPLVPPAIRAVQRLGFLRGIDVPDIPVGGDPVENRAVLGAALGREISADTAQLVVWRSDAIADAGRTLDTTRQLMTLARRAVVAALVVTVLAAAGAIAVANRRLRTAATLLIVAAVAFVVVRVAVGVALGQAGSIPSDPGAQAAVDATLGTLTSGLRTTLVVFAVVAALAAAALVAIPRVLGGRRRTAAAAR